MEACEIAGVRFEPGDFMDLTDAELDAILFAVQQALQALDDEVVADASAFEAADTGKSVSGYFSQLDGITGDLESGKISLAAYDQKMHDTIHSNFTKVYAANRGAPLNAGDLEYLRRATAEEMKYARKFGSDIANDTLRMPRQQRAGMYAQTLQGIGDHAKVEAAPDNSQFVWKLGDAEHCPDCIVLASQSPYTKANLPTTPRAGATRCLSNCKCSLIIQRGKLTKDQVKDMKELTGRKEQSLSELFAPPAPPPGMRAATATEQKYIDNLRMKVNTNRRLIATATDKDTLKKAIQARKMANAELIEFLEKQSIYEVPVWSVDDVLSGRDIGRRAVQEIFHHGLDGRTLDLVGKRQLLSMLGEYERAVGESLNGDTLAKMAKKQAAGGAQEIPARGAVQIDTRRTEKLVDKMTKGELTKQEQAELRDELDKMFEGTGMSADRRTWGPGNKPGTRRKEIKISEDLRAGFAGEYSPAWDSVAIDRKTADNALKFLQGERTEEALDGMKTLIHEVTHSYNLGDGVSSYKKLGLVFEEAGTDLVAIQTLADAYGLEFHELAARATYLDYIDHIAMRTGQALKNAGLEFSAGPRTMQRLALRYSQDDYLKVVDQMTDAFKKMMGPGSEVKSWEALVDKFSKTVEIPPSMLEGLSNDEILGVKNRFRRELRKHMRDWVKSKKGSYKKLFKDVI